MTSESTKKFQVAFKWDHIDYYTTFLLRCKKIYHEKFPEFVTFMSTTIIFSDQFVEFNWGISFCKLRIFAASLPFIVAIEPLCHDLMPRPHSWDAGACNMKICLFVVWDTLILSIVEVTSLAIIPCVFQCKRIPMAGKARGYGLTAELQRKVKA